MTVEGFLPVSDEQVEKNLNNARNLGLKRLEPGPRVPLAIVGGGLSIHNHVERLKNWDGHVWAINGAWRWCEERGIDATFISVDPHPIVAKWASGARKAILHEQCPIEAFDVLKDADVTVYDARGCSGSTVGSAITAGAKTGHESITLFGCESCFQMDRTHAYQKEDRAARLIVCCDGDFFLTAPDFYFQAQKLAELIKGLDGYVTEESGGLLRAFIKKEQHFVLWVSEEMARGFKPVKKDL